MEAILVALVVIMGMYYFVSVMSHLYEYNKLNQHPSNGRHKEVKTPEVINLSTSVKPPTNPRKPSANTEEGIRSHREPQPTEVIM